MEGIIMETILVSCLALQMSIKESGELNLSLPSLSFLCHNSYYQQQQDEFLPNI